MKMNLIFHAFLILTMLSFCIASTPNTICFFRTYITNALEDDIVIHITGKKVSNIGDDDQGNRTLASNEEYDWKYGVKIGTYYLGEFWWGSRYASVSIYNYDIFGSCYNENPFMVQRCYWLVKPDGLYNHVRNDSFPGHWTRKKTWDQIL